jgi:hypothetical protein
MSCRAFRIGSDGENWWWHFEGPTEERKVVVCPAKDIRTLNSSICDPFDLLNQAPDQAAAALGLHLIAPNEAVRPGNHFIEAWNVRMDGSRFVWGQCNQWHIDSHDFRPVEVGFFHPLGVGRLRFHYDAVNEPLSDKVFAVPRIEGVSPERPEALDNDDTQRFINLCDGSDGNMRVRWGKRGPRGTSSSGLN